MLTRADAHGCCGRAGRGALTAARAVRCRCWPPNSEGSSLLVVYGAQLSSRSVVACAPKIMHPHPWWGPSPVARARPAAIGRLPMGARTLLALAALRTVCLPCCQPRWRQADWMLLRSCRVAAGRAAGACPETVPAMSPSWATLSCAARSLFTPTASQNRHHLGGRPAVRAPGWRRRWRQRPPTAELGPAVLVTPISRVLSV